MPEQEETEEEKVEMGQFSLGKVPLVSIQKLKMFNKMCDAELLKLGYDTIPQRTKIMRFLEVFLPTFYEYMTSDLSFREAHEKVQGEVQREDVKQRIEKLYDEYLKSAKELFDQSLKKRLEENHGR